VATILSAQCTDVRVNQITPELFRKYPTVVTYAGAEQEALERDIFTAGFYRNKAKAIIGMARAVLERYGGEIPGTMEELVELPGVGRKTASVLLATWFGVPAIAVDTHVTRLANRLGLTGSDDPDRIELDLRALFPEEDWGSSSHALIWHGRRVCHARKPACDRCCLADLCPSTQSQPE
jgi:endonuclease-3